MAWTPYIPVRQLVDASGRWVIAIDGTSFTAFQKPLAVNAGIPSGSSRYWGRQLETRLRREVRSTDGTVIGGNNALHDANFDAAAAGAGGGGNVRQWVPPFTGDTGYFLEETIADCNGDTIVDCTHYDATMQQAAIVADFADIAAYRPSRPNEFAAWQHLVEGADFEPHPTTGEYIQYLDGEEPAIDELWVVSGSGRGQGGSFADLDDDSTVIVGHEPSLSATAAAGWVNPGDVAAAATYDTLAAGFQRAAFLEAAVDGLRLSARLVGANCAGGWYGSFTADGVPTPFYQFDTEASTIGFSHLYAYITYPSFRFWTTNVALLRWLNHLSPLVFQWLFSDAWLSIRIHMTQSYY